MPLRRNGDAVSPERGVRFAGTRVRSGVDGVPSHPTATQTPAATGTRGSTNGFVFHPLGENGKSTSPLKTKVAAPIPAFQLLFLGLRFRGHLKKDPHAHATPCHMRGGGVVARGNLAITSGAMSSTPDAPVSPPQLAERGRAPPSAFPARKKTRDNHFFLGD